ncbi:anti-sigma factor family protein [Tateyamaria sp. SN3-11]|uniref:anti-sigma factor family protein n=1 Tax=Tateyamaria sp. SN3-11 TaxID=3092147 RepID=UPI0039ECC7FC
MTEMRPFTDEDLTAFLDGEADDALRAEIEAALETDAALGERVASLDIPLVPIAVAYDALLATAPPMPDLPEVAVAPPPATRFGWGWGIGTFGTGLAAGLAVALFTGFGTPEPAPRGWISFVASYQALYTTATLSIDNPSPAEATMQLAAVSDALDLDLSALPQAQGLTFKRAQVLGFRGKPLVQIAFLRDDGTPVALCIIPSGPDEKPLDMGEAEGLDIARWNTPGYGFLLIGGTDADPLAQEAETFRDWSQDTAT